MNARREILKAQADAFTAKQELQALRKLVPYVGHKMNCSIAINDRRPAFSKMAKIKCTCGLDAPRKDSQCLS